MGNWMLTVNLSRKGTFPQPRIGTGGIGLMPSGSGVLIITRVASD